MKPPSYGLKLNKDGQRRSAFELLAYPEIGWPEIRGIWPELSAIEPGIAVHLEIDAKYDVYLKRQTADVDAFRRDEGLILGDIDYAVGAGAFQRSALETRSRASADGGAGGPARWHDAGGARHPGGLSATGSAPERLRPSRSGMFHVKQDAHGPMANASIATESSAPAQDRAEALKLTPVSRETEARLDRYRRPAAGMAGQDQSGRAIDASDSLDAPRLRFAAASGDRAIGEDMGRPRQRRRFSRRGPGLCPGGNRRRARCIWSSAMPKKPPSCAKRCASPAHQAWFIWPTSGILWIASRAESIASPPGPWLR